MFIACPKCEYIRKPEDHAPDYECPKCGVIYAKAKPNTQNTVSNQLNPRVINAGSSSWRPFGYHPILVFIAISFTFSLAWIYGSWRAKEEP